ncbi:hypothetical protein DNTS_022776 [Danionella cerebrum]|uniref:Ig-like domain-containing protein n=1 Tax=Danionella cerebrum TaxID=2873325 RepID=A0A553QDG6_9TELE|nr:hypothetical protein DNTS_022776 [Danionella translucida]TRY87959.1 hypothetical protein DNTS_022776 [Danionella translucida]
MFMGLKYFIWTVAVLLTKESSQSTISGVTGGSVILPCSSTEDEIKPQDCNVYWRHNDTKRVCDIVKGEVLVAQQYSGRAEPFPEEYGSRNFSIKLLSLKQTDSGLFSCFITPTDEYKSIELIVVHREPQKETTTTIYDTTINVKEGSSPSHMVWIAIGIFILMLVVVAIVYLCKNCFKKAPVTEFSVVMNLDEEH